MAAVLLLEDGRALKRSNLGYCGMLELISREVPDPNSRLRVWLSDKARRTSPFCEFDLRGLIVEDRNEFWASSERALASLIERRGPENSWSDNMYASESLAHLIRMHQSILAGESPSALNDLREVIKFKGETEDLDEIWYDKDG